MTSPVTSERAPSSIDSVEDCPRTLRDGRATLVGLIDGYPSYYDRRRRRIDVLLDDGEGNRYPSEYYRFGPDETVREFVRQAERDGCRCEVRTRWTSKRTHRARPRVPSRLRRYGRALYGRLVRALRAARARRTSEET
jgi:hypothetical protein